MGWKDVGNLIMLELSRGAGTKMSPVSALCPKLPRARCWFGRETGVKFSNSPTTGIFLETSEKSNSWNCHQGNVWWALRCFLNPNAKWSRCGNAMKRKMRVARAAGYRGGRGLGGWVVAYIWVVNVCQVTLVRRATRGRGMNKTLKPWSISLEWILKPWNISLEWIHIGNVSFCPADFETQKLKVWIKCRSLSIWPCAHVSASKISRFYSKFTTTSDGHNMCYFTFKSFLSYPQRVEYCFRFILELSFD